MSKIYPFSQGLERQAMKNIAKAKGKKTLEKPGRIVMIYVRQLWFALRITFAMLHIVTVEFSTLLHACKECIFVIGGLGYIIMYYHLNKHFIAPDNSSHYTQVSAGKLQSIRN